MIRPSRGTLQAIKADKLTRLREEYQRDPAPSNTQYGSVWVEDGHEPTVREVRLGAAAVRDTFKISKVGTIAGCLVQDGIVKRNAHVRLLRDNVVIHTGRVSSLKRFKDDATEVKSGTECGIGIAGYNDVKPGDVIEFFTTETVKETLA